MIIKYYFKDHADVYQECKASTMNVLTNRLKQTLPNVGPVWVPIKLVVLNLNENETVKNLRVFLTVSSNLGSAEHLINNDLVANRGDLLSFTNDPPSGLYFNTLDGDEVERIQFSHQEGDFYGTGIPLLDESNDEGVGNNEFKEFQIKFIPSASQSNEKFFVSLEADGEIVSVEEGG